MKKCPRCKKEKPRTKKYFYSDVSHLDGLSSRCRICSLEDNRIRLQKYQSQWKKYFERNAKSICQICRKQLSWFNKKRNQSDSVYFDHKHGYKSSKIRTPSHWLRYRPSSQKNRKIWESEDFGILCRDCNRILPSSPKRRKQLSEYIK